jgi:hypothetical protein
MSFVAGDLSEKSVVNVSVSKSGGPSLTASRVFVPVMLDMILEADTYTPSFYKGRSLPIKDASVRIVTVLNGTPLNPSEYAYKWSLGNTVLFGGPVRGKMTAEMTMPSFSNKRLWVEVFDQKGILVAENSMILEFFEPELFFYEESPLRGLVGRAIGEEWLMKGEETTFTAVPYYFNVPLISGDTHYDWEINNKNVYPDFKTPNKFSVQKPEDGDSFWLSLEMITSIGIPQFVKNEFKLLFR